MPYIFPIAVIANSLSMTAMLILFSLAGQSHFSADIGIAQAATTALFYAFSANSRVTVLASPNSSLAKSLLDIRATLLVPLSLAAFWLTSTLGGVEPYLACILILRRVVEWLVEVDLSEKERSNNQRFALTFVVAQTILLVIGFFWFLTVKIYPLLGLFLWALFPLLLSFNFLWIALGSLSKEMATIRKRMAPHFGSSFAIGVSLYVFRLLVIALWGKNMSGDLFAAFAIGGVAGSVFVGAFGPSIAFNEKRTGVFQLPRLLTVILWVFTGLGLAIYCLSMLKPDIFAWSGKGVFFGRALALSMIGGVVMVHAQLLRNRLLIHNEHHDLWGPDLLMNVLIITAVPLVSYWGGIDAAIGLSLLSALLAWAFYKSSELCEIAQTNERMLRNKYFQLVVAVSVLLPLFVTLKHGLFQSREISQTGYPSLLLIPVPLSLFIIYLAILLVGAYRDVRISVGMLFFSFLLMAFTTLVVSEAQRGISATKLTLLIQFILPMGGLILGEMFKIGTLKSSTQVEKAFLWALCTIIPLQLLATWIQGEYKLSGYLYIFSIYQYLDYIPNIFVSAYILAMFSLWQERMYRYVLLLIAPLMGIYVAASLNISAMLFLSLGALIFATIKSKLVFDKLAVVLFAVIFLSSFSYVSVVIGGLPETKNLTNLVMETGSAWRYYAADTTESMKSLIFGHAESLDRTTFTSAHNYLLDMIRNFGLVTIIPVLAVLGYTVRTTYLVRQSFVTDINTLGLPIVLAYLLVIDNATQVSLRQPYSGVYTFFIWGLFLARLSQLKAINENLTSRKHQLPNN